MAEWENSNGGSDEYYAPPEMTMKLPGFDLDPCCPENWGELMSSNIYTIRANTHWTKSDDALSKNWSRFGSVWMNPPFGRRLGIIPWLEKFIEHGNGIALVRAYTSSGWWHEYVPKFDMILFPEGKTKFMRPDGTQAKQPGHGVALLSIGYEMTRALQESGLGMACFHMRTKVA